MTTPEIPLDRVRAHWTRAAGFPVDKCAVYPEHAKAQEFDLAKGKNVLEYGCGGGSDTLSYLRAGAMVAFADIVPSNVATTAARVAEVGLSPYATAVPLEASASIPLPTGTFDVVSSHGVLHHIVDPLPVLQEFHRLLKPGGNLYVMLYTEFLERRCSQRMLELIARHKLSHAEAFGWCTDEEGTPYARSYTVPDGMKLLLDAGFRVLWHLEYNKKDFRTFKAVRI